MEFYNQDTDTTVKKPRPARVMSSQWFRLGASSRGAGTLVLCAVCISCSWFQRYRILTTLPVGQQGNSIVIMEDVYFDNGRRLYYQVKNGEKVVVDRRFICSQLDTGKHSDFKTSTARDGNLV